MHSLLGFLLFLAPTLTTTTTLNFDTLPTPHGLTPLTSYANLTFTHASVFTPLSPSLRYIITPNDYNCAVSSPNALIGGRDVEGGRGMGFGIAEGEGKGTFELQQFWVKPMDFPEGGDVRVHVFGYRSPSSPIERRGANDEVDDEGHGEEVLKWHVDFPAGYHLPFLVKMDEYSKQSWTGLRSVEIVADYGEQKLDWEVCLDDLVVLFEDGGSGADEGREEYGRVGRGDVEGQVVLGDGG
ncbi:MAG: hypothetical protein Q9176_000733 [Flavoplaca citrina]